MVRCSECKFGEFFHGLNEDNIMYYCHCFEEWIEEKTAELDELGCDGYVNDDRYDDTTA